VLNIIDKHIYNYCRDLDCTYSQTYPCGHLYYIEYGSSQLSGKKLYLISHLCYMVIFIFPLLTPINMFYCMFCLNLYRA